MSLLSQGHQNRCCKCSSLVPQGSDSCILSGMLFIALSLLFSPTNSGVGNVSSCCLCMEGFHTGGRREVSVTHCWSVTNEQRSKCVALLVWLGWSSCSSEQLVWCRLWHLWPGHLGSTAVLLLLLSSAGAAPKPSLVFAFSW